MPVIHRPLHHTDLRRLAFVKFLYATAINQSRSPEITAAASLLTFHDAVEAFLLIAAERNGIKDPREFGKYWEEFDPVLKPEVLPQKQSLARLSKARVALKHHGNLPALADIESHRQAVTLFFTEATKLLFDIEFSQISMVEYVEPAEARTHLTSAQMLINVGDMSKASCEVITAFEVMVMNYVQSKGRDPFHFGSDMSFMSSFFMRIPTDERGDMGRFIDATRGAITSMQQAMRILALGLNYKKYTHFRSLLPSFDWSGNGTPLLQTTPERQGKLTNEYLHYCIDYVIECSIKLGEDGA